MTKDHRELFTWVLARVQCCAPRPSLWVFLSYVFWSFSCFCPERVQAPLCPPGLWSILPPTFCTKPGFYLPPLRTVLAAEPTDCRGGASPSPFLVYEDSKSHHGRCVFTVLGQRLFLCPSHEWLGVLILLKVPPELAQPLWIPTWLRHLILGMNFSNLPPRIWERWVNSSSLICDPSPAWKTIAIKPPLR